MTITRPSGVDKSYRRPLTLRQISTSMSCMLYIAVTAIGVGNEFSFGGAGTDLKLMLMCSLVYYGPPTKKNPVVWASVAKVDTHPGGSPLVQGGLEIPAVEVTVTMPYSEKNRSELDKYEELVKKHYPGT